MTQPNWFPPDYRGTGWPAKFAQYWMIFTFFSLTFTVLKMASGFTKIKLKKKQLKNVGGGIRTPPPWHDIVVKFPSNQDGPTRCRHVIISVMGPSFVLHRLLYEIHLLLLNLMIWKPCSGLPSSYFMNGLNSVMEEQVMQLLDWGTLQSLNYSFVQIMYKAWWYTVGHGISALAQYLAWQYRIVGKQMESPSHHIDVLDQYCHVMSMFSHACNRAFLTISIASILHIMQQQPLSVVSHRYDYSRHLKYTQQHALNQRFASSKNRPLLLNLIACYTANVNRKTVEIL